MTHLPQDAGPTLAETTAKYPRWNESVPIDTDAHNTQEDPLVHAWQARFVGDPQSGPRREVLVRHGDHDSDLSRYVRQPDILPTWTRDPFFMDDTAAFPDVRFDEPLSNMTWLLADGDELGGLESQAAIALADLPVAIVRYANGVHGLILTGGDTNGGYYLAVAFVRLGWCPPTGLLPSLTLTEPALQGVDPDEHAAVLAAAVHNAIAVRDQLDHQLHAARRD